MIYKFIYITCVFEFYLKTKTDSFLKFIRCRCHAGYMGHKCLVPEYKDDIYIHILYVYTYIDTETCIFFDYSSHCF